MATNDLAALHRQITNKLQGLCLQPSLYNWVTTLQDLHNSYPGLEISLGLPGYKFQVELRHTAPDPHSCYSRAQIGIILHPGPLRPAPKDPIPDPINPFPAADTHQPGNLPVWLL